MSADDVRFGDAGRRRDVEHQQRVSRHRRLARDLRHQTPTPFRR